MGRGALRIQVCLSLCFEGLCLTCKLAQEPTQLQQINLIKFGGSQEAKGAHRGVRGALGALESRDRLACKPMVLKVQRTAANT